MTRLHLLAALGGLAAVAAGTAWLHARRVARLAAIRVRTVSGTVRRLRWTVLFGAALCGVDWLTATYVHDWRVLLAVFCPPSLLAGNSLARLAEIAEFTREEDI
jgi:hypothetical protein